jgi:hypothetical protein
LRHAVERDLLVDLVWLGAELDVSAGRFDGQPAVTGEDELHAEVGRIRAYRHRVLIGDAGVDRGVVLVSLRDDGPARRRGTPSEWRSTHDVARRVPYRPRVAADIREVEQVDAGLEPENLSGAAS